MFTSFNRIAETIEQLPSLRASQWVVRTRTPRDLLIDNPDAVVPQPISYYLNAAVWEVECVERSIQIYSWRLEFQNPDASLRRDTRSPASGTWRPSGGSNSFELTWPPVLSPHILVDCFVKLINSGNYLQSNARIFKHIQYTLLG